MPKKNFNKPSSFKLTRIKNINLLKPYNQKYAKRVYNNLYFKNTILLNKYYANELNNDF